MNVTVKEVIVETDQWSRWRAALAGRPLDLGERGNPPSGYYRFPPSKTAKSKPQEAVSVWCDEAGDIQCARNIYGDGAGMTAMQIDEMFASEHYSIPYELYVAVTERGEPWPELYTTRLRTKDIAAGIIWTEEWARARLAADVETRDEAGNPRAVIGDNEPPRDLSAAEALAARIEAVGKALAGFLSGIGGAPKTKAEADTVANYATKFNELANEATATHKIEKKPHLDAGREVDGRWFPVRDKADACRKKALGIADAWINAEKARLAEEARKANEAARCEAERAAAISGEAPAPIQEVVVAPIKIGTGRTVSQRIREVWVVTDMKAFVGYLLAMETVPPDLVATCKMLATRLGVAGVKAPGIEMKERSASQ